MTERLIIRLASKASHKNHWLIWSDSENEIIASGAVDNAEQLNALTEKAQYRQVVCLLPSVDVYIKEVVINGVYSRHIQQALPYLVEEELASDVETLHFSVLSKQADLLHVAICNKQKIIAWQAWLESAQISCKQFMPEGLALPVVQDGQWQAIQLGNNWIIRESEQLAWGCESAMLAFMLESKLQDNPAQQIVSYSPLPENCPGQWLHNGAVLAMELLARGTLHNKTNVLTGEFKPEKEANKQLKKWRVTGILSAVFVLLLMLNLHLKKTQVQAQTALVKLHVETVYQQAFPLQNKLKYVRIKKKIKTMLRSVDSGTAKSGFLQMLNELLPAFLENAQLKPTSIKFDSQKKEMRILISGDSFQAFEKLTSSLTKHFGVEQGALNSSNNRVSGLLTIREK